MWRSQEKILGQKVNVKFKDKYYLISFDKKQKSIAKGQFVAIYNGDNLISSGIID